MLDLQNINNCLNLFNYYCNYYVTGNQCSNRDFINVFPGTTNYKPTGDLTFYFKQYDIVKHNTDMLTLETLGV